MADLTKAKKMRGGHRAYLTKLLMQAGEMLANFNEEALVEADQLKESIADAIKNIQKLDEDIVTLIANDAESTEEHIMKEIENSAKVRADARKTLKKIEEKLSLSQNTPVIVPSSAESASSESSTSKVHAKLPKLEVKRFKGNVCKWQEFWDSFESSIHSNSCLSNVDKFNYLRGLLEEPAKSCIAGFSLTGANYPSAVEILKDRYGKKSVVQRAHMQQLMKT